MYCYLLLSFYIYLCTVPSNCHFTLIFVLFPGKMTIRDNSTFLHNNYNLDKHIDIDERQNHNLVKKTTPAKYIIHKI
jgi:hypothetical protein